MGTRITARARHYKKKWRHRLLERVRKFCTFFVGGDINYEKIDFGTFFVCTEAFLRPRIKKCTISRSALVSTAFTSYSFWLYHTKKKNIPHNEGSFLLLFAGCDRFIYNKKRSDPIIANVWLFSGGGDGNLVVLRYLTYRVDLIQILVTFCRRTRTISKSWAYCSTAHSPGSNKANKAHSNLRIMIKS